MIGESRRKALLHNLASPLEHIGKCRETIRQEVNRSRYVTHTYHRYVLQYYPTSTTRVRTQKLVVVGKGSSGYCLPISDFHPLLQTEVLFLGAGSEGKRSRVAAVARCQPQADALALCLSARPSDGVAGLAPPKPTELCRRAE